MRKTFQLHIEGKHRDRVLDATKHEIRKYVKRQRRVPLPDGVDFWDFDCRFGLDKESAETIAFPELNTYINQAAQAGAAAFYLELLAKHGHWVRAPRSPEQLLAEELGEEGVQHEPHEPHETHQSELP